MNSRIIGLILFGVLFVSCSGSRKISQTDTPIIENLKAHIQYLSDDRLEGRRTGTAGEKLAMDYISDQFKIIGLIPDGTEGYIQPFEVNDGRQIDKQTVLIIDGDTLHAGKQFFPFPFSASQTIEALPSISVQEADMPWFFDLKDLLEENKNNPHFDLSDYILKNAVKAKDRGASAVILYNSSSIPDNLSFDPKDKSPFLTIPVLYVEKEAAQKHFTDLTAALKIKILVSLSDKLRTGHNVIGYIDNHAAGTVILGAHFDHLGYGEDGNSMIRHFDTPMIHNGADDNASGTAALIEMARKLKNAKLNNNNYLFIAFSGEELGLFGSKYFVEHPTIDLKTASYMINMDMVGRLNDSNKVVTLGGYGTSPAWGDIFPGASLQIKNSPLRFKYDSSGTGPSDHSTFYRKDIPVLFYFTGLHADYHKPSDDADKINYTGEQLIVRHIFSVIESMNTKGKPLFTKTRETQTSTSTRFSVTMGIMPDYTYAGTGVRADGVSDGKPAQKAGLQGGDIILQIGDYNTSSLETYMQALGKFKKGDRVKVKYKRGNEMKEADVEF